MFELSHYRPSKSCTTLPPKCLLFRLTLRLTALCRVRSILLHVWLLSSLRRRSSSCAPCGTSKPFSTTRSTRSSLWSPSPCSFSSQASPSSLFLMTTSHQCPVLMTSLCGRAASRLWKPRTIMRHSMTQTGSLWCD